ncbi:hypothetical protein DLJ49_09225 [Rhodovulum sp. 12E13]|nr:hypothetical protein DLJ49_09225 [Rhodovulum sp. 12E13]
MEELVIYTFPFVAYVVFATTKLLHAIPATVLAGFLLLPPRYAFNLPLLPTIDKANVIALTVAGLALAFAPRPGRAAAPAFDHVAAQEMLPGLLPRERWALVCVVSLVLVVPVGTVLTNRSGLVLADGFVPGLTFRDIGNSVWLFGLPLLTLLTARKFLGGEAGQRTVLYALLLAGLFYSLPTLLEIRLSPQLHNWIYGGFPHSWIQHLRGGGFRPVVFMTHGLVLALFLCMSLLAALACLRVADFDRRWLYAVAAGHLFLVLVLSKSLGALMIALVLAPLIMLCSVRTQLLAAAAIAIFVTTYPAVRGAGVNPFGTVAHVVEAAGQPSRASSLRFRLAQEEILTRRGWEKPLFGWGGFGRAMDFEAEGRHASVRDGLWLITFGERGVVGFLAYFGLFAFPLVLLAARSRRIEVSPATTALAVILAANLLDLIPNSGSTVVTMLIAGALIGRLEHARQTAPAGATQAATAPVGGERTYGRSAPQAARARAGVGAGLRAGGAMRTASAARAQPALPVAPARPRGPAQRAGPTEVSRARDVRYTRFPAGPPSSEGE